MLTLLLVVCTAASSADDPEVTSQPGIEHQVKAVFLLRFAQFTEWPTHDDGAPLVVAVVGEDPFGPYLDSVADELSIDGRAVEVRRFATVHDIRDSEPLALVFISRSSAKDLSTVLALLKRRPVLTVSDVEGFVGRGGIIELVTERNRVSFRIDRQAARASGLRLSSKLLRAAAAVENG
jgi:hypothetical protein